MSDTSFSGTGFKYTPPGGGGGSLWYAPLGTAPTVLPVATGLGALAMGDGAQATRQQTIAIGTNADATGGNGSIVIGYETTSNDFSTVIGYNANNAGSGSYNVSVGYNTSTTGNGAVAIGNNSVASAESSTAVGNSTLATALSSLAAGHQAYSDGAFGTAVGPATRAGRTGSVAVGYGAQTGSGNYTIAIGYSAYSDGTNSVCIGFDSTSTHYNSIALGTSINTATDNELARSDVGAGTTLLGRLISPLRSVTTTDGAATNFPAITIPNNSACAFHGRCAAYRTAGAGVVGDSASWNINGLVKQVGGTYTMVAAVVGAAGAPTYNDAGAAGWTLALAIVGNVIVATATGQAGETIDWELTIESICTN